MSLYSLTFSTCLLLFLIILVQAIEWQAHTSRYADIPDFHEFSQAMLTAPQDYAYPEGPKLSLHVRKMGFGEPDTHVWLIAGGPGVKANEFEFHAAHFVSAYPKNTWFYFLEHRGIGLSSKVTTRKTVGKCIENPKVCQEMAGYPLQILSPDNAARDLVSVATLVKEEHPDKKHVLHGISYGSIVALRALYLAPSLFYGAIFAGFSPSLRLRDADLRHHLMENCKSNPYCVQKCSKGLKGDPAEYYLNIIPQLNADMHRNKCLRAITKFEGTESAISSVIRVLLHSNPRARNIEYPALVLPLLRQLDTCKSPDRFHRLMAYLFDAYRLTASKSSIIEQIETLWDPLSATSSSFNGRRSDEFLLHFINACERQNFDHGRCLQSSRSHYINNCLPSMHTHIDRFRDFCYKLDESRDIPSLPLAKTKLVLLAGKLDPQTPFDIATKYFSSLQTGSTKQSYEFKNESHSFLANDCLRPITKAMLAEGNTKDEVARVTLAKACVAKMNMDSLNWDQLETLSYDFWSTDEPIWHWYLFLIIVSIALSPLLATISYIAHKK